MSNSDINILNGISSIINPGNSRGDVDLRELERQMVNDGVISRKAQDPQDRFSEELKASAAKLGIQFGETLKKETEPEPEEDVRPARAPDYAHESYTTGPESYTRGFADYTQEQTRRRQIETVVGRATSGNEFSLEDEKREDAKHVMLAEIDTLITDLTRTGIDISRVPQVDKDSSYEDVQSVHTILRLKDDQSTYCNIATEVIMFGAHLLGDVFDGNRTWFGRYRFNLRGWHHHVGAKLHRMRHSTSVVVKSFLDDYNVGPGTRILLELVPSMVLYSRRQSVRNSEPGIFADDDMRQSISDIRNITESKSQK